MEVAVDSIIAAHYTVQLFQREKFLRTILEITISRKKPEQSFWIE